MNTDLLNILTPFASAGLTWFLARRKYRAESKANELENVEKAISIWKNLAIDLKKEVEQLKTELIEHKQQIDNLRKLVNKR